MPRASGHLRHEADVADDVGHASWGQVAESGEGEGVDAVAAVVVPDDVEEGGVVGDGEEVAVGGEGADGGEAAGEEADLTDGAVAELERTAASPFEAGIAEARIKVAKGEALAGDATEVVADEGMQNRADVAPIEGKEPAVRDEGPGGRVASGDQSDLAHRAVAQAPCGPWGPSGPSLPWGP